jgi:hypothetical protein
VPSSNPRNTQLACSSRRSWSCSQQALSKHPERHEVVHDAPRRVCAAVQITYPEDSVKARDGVQ